MNKHTKYKIHHHQAYYYCCSKRMRGAIIASASSDLTCLLSSRSTSNSFLSAILKSPAAAAASFSSTPNISSPFALDGINDTIESSTHLVNLVEVKCRLGTLNRNEAVGLFNSMLQISQPPISIFTFNQLFTTLQKMKHYTMVISMCKQMILSGCYNGAAKIKPNIATLNIVINCYCCLNRVDLGFSVLCIHVKCGIELTPRTITPLLRGLYTQNKMEDAVQLFHSIVEEGHLCNEFTYSIMMDGLCRNGHAQKAVEILRQMVEERRHKPDVVTYNTVINGLCKERKTDMALRVFEKDMMDAGVVPNLLTYNTLIHRLCELGLWTEATRLLHKMHDSGIYPDIVTCNSIVDALCKRGRKKEALRVVQAMARGNLKPEAVTYTSLIQKFCHSGHLAEVVELSESTFNALIDALCKERGIKEAHSMVEPGSIPDFIIYLLDRLCHSDRWKEIPTLFKQMLTQGICPDLITFNVLLDGICKDGMMAKAYEVLQLMIQGGVKPDTVTYSTLIHGHCLLGEMDKAMDVFDSMESTSCAPDAVTYYTLISGYVKIERFDEAQRLVEEMIQKGFKPNAATLNIVEAYRSKGYG